jgi:TIR domain
MARLTFTRDYRGLAPDDVAWAALVGLFDSFWGEDARSLPSYPLVLDGVSARWKDADGVDHRAEHLDELGEAYKRHETTSLTFSGQLEGTSQVSFRFHPAAREAFVNASAQDLKSAEHVVAAVRAIFPISRRYVFVSYATADLRLAEFVAGLLERRLGSEVKVFVAHRDIGPGRDPRRTMLEENLLQATALVALCSFESKLSGWVWWETSSVWTRNRLVVPLFVDVGPTEFGGPLPLVLQGRQLFEIVELEEALRIVSQYVSPETGVVPLTDDELRTLHELKADQDVTAKKRDPVRDQRFKDLLDLILELKDASFDAMGRGDRFSAEMANAQYKMRTLLGQLSDETFPPRVTEYSNANQAGSVTGIWQTVYEEVERLLASPHRAS